MPTIRSDDERLLVEFTAGESLMVRRHRLTVPIAAVTAVTVLPGWTSELLGMRSGMAVSGVLKLGTFTHPDGTRRLVAMRRGLPALRVGLRQRLDGVDELLLSSPEAATVAARLRRGAPA